MLSKVNQCTECISANTMSHQFRWGNREMGLLFHTGNAVKWLALSIW